MSARAVGMLAASGLAATTLSGCASMPKSSPNDFTSRTGQAAGVAMGDTYSGFGEAAQAPLRDLNLMHDDVPPILVRAYARPYDQTGLDGCPAISEQVRQLDLALGPDVDIPLGATPDKDMFAKGAGFAADAALDAVRSATTGVIPVRSWVRRFSGANRAEQQAKAVALAGSVRRGYLKALGQIKGCEWPAAPLQPQMVQAKTAAVPSPQSPSPAPGVQPVAQASTPATAMPQH